MKSKLLKALEKLTATERKKLGKFIYVPEDKCLLSSAPNKKTQFYFQKVRSGFLFGQVMGNVCVGVRIIKN